MKMTCYLVRGVYVRVSKYARFCGYNRLYSLSRGLLLMLYSNLEFSNYSRFMLHFVNRWFFYKGINNNAVFSSSVDYWSKDKQKELLVYKTRLFFTFLSAQPQFKYRPQSLGFRNSYKPSTLFVAGNTRFIINLRHFLFYGFLFQKSRCKTITAGNGL